MSHPLQQEVCRELEAMGWTLEITKRNHIKATHPLASRPIWLPGTPGSHRTNARIRTLARRVLEGRS